MTHKTAIYHLVTPELQSGGLNKLTKSHLSSLQNISIYPVDIDVL